MTKRPETELEKWLKANRLSYTLAGDTLLLFNPPPALADAHASAIVPETEHGRAVAKMLRGFCWAVRSTSNQTTAIKWLASLGYGRMGHVDGRPVVRVPRGQAIYGESKLDLVMVAGHVVNDPAITSRKLAERLSEKLGRRVERRVAERAMVAIGWTPEERESFRVGAIGAPVLVEE